MAGSLADAPFLSMELTEFWVLRDLIHRHTGIWLGEHKQVMLASRLARRLRAHGLADFAEYCDMIQSRDGAGAELGELINCVTTNKTSFFRERHHFEFLAGTVLPQIMSPNRATAEGRDSPAASKTVRIWSAACSTGEEPYSIAITLLKHQSAVAPGSRYGWSFKILASDIDTQVLATAKRGIYPAEALEELDPACRAMHFLRGTGQMSGQMRIKDHLAEMVEFQRINLMDAVWPLRGTFDAVFFRNALIYFKQETQDLFLRRIVRHLKPGGYLFLGHSEHIPWLQDILEPQKNTVYRLRGGAR